MCHLRHRFQIKIMFHSQDIQVFVFLTIPWFTESVMSREYIDISKDKRVHRYKQGQ